MVPGSLVKINSKVCLRYKNLDLIPEFFYRSRIDNPTTKAVFVMLSDEKNWLKNNFDNEPDIGFPGYYSRLAGVSMFSRIIFS